MDVTFTKVSGCRYRDCALVHGRRGDVEHLIVDHGCVVGNATREAIIDNRRIAGLSAGVFAELVAEVGPLWPERHQATLVSRPRKRAVGAGAKHRLVFVDRLLATLVETGAGGGSVWAPAAC
ncbi:hypothetical protein [Streptomyces sp. LN704]|uniref:hypothetical protein n=1 Tax=unclassified Streptomyces TaxID=2593676 RepID=UPI00372036B7